MLTLNEAKSFLRIDFDDDDSDINSLVLAADLFVVGASSQNVDKESELYKLACKLLVSHWYLNREVVGKADKLAFSLNEILFQLKYTTVAP
ncbi:head-tail connector protein [Gottfriedia sp. NPDC056225]|uniref:head-tail connector protein n=1 Tax=Gottfriedia sp. NPDC056225 TaxID=3345751 RepID=UPI0035D5D168